MQNESMQKWRERWWQDPQGALEAWEMLIADALEQSQLSLLWQLLEWWADIPLGEDTRKRIGDELWGKTHIVLGGVRLKVAEVLGTPALMEALEHFQLAQTVFTKEQSPLQWAQVHSILGIIYAQLPTGDKVENFQKSNAHFEAALTVYTETDYPEDWAMMVGNLATNYYRMPIGDKVENLLKALEYYQATLRVRTRTRLTDQWARTLVNMGTIYYQLPVGDRIENLQKARDLYQEALTVFTLQDYPEEWAISQYTLGQIYSALYDETDDLDLLRRAREGFALAMHGFKTIGQEMEARDAAIQMFRTHAMIESAESEASQQRKKRE